jgi:hypothetical protein
VVGRGSVRTGRCGHPRATVEPPEQIENENDDDDEKDCSKDRATLKVAVGRGSVRTEYRLAALLRIRGAILNYFPKSKLLAEIPDQTAWLSDSDS